MLNLGKLLTLARLTGFFVLTSLLVSCSQVAVTSGTAATDSSNGSSTTTGATTSIALTGVPASSAPAGSLYVFQPTVSEGSGIVTFSIEGLPVWANFDTTTGVLSGTPTAAQVGIYPNIVIRATNGALSATLPAFAITVTLAPPGSATVQWVAPTNNTNGSALTDLAGYVVYWGTSSNALTQTSTVSNASATSYKVAGLAAGTWYFAVQAYDSHGNQSALSNIASKTF
jgi:hypothetical protein